MVRKGHSPVRKTKETGNSLQKYEEGEAYDAAARPKDGHVSPLAPSK